MSRFIKAACSKNKQEREELRFRKESLREKRRKVRMYLEGGDGRNWEIFELEFGEPNTPNFFPLHLQ